MPMFVLFLSPQLSERGARHFSGHETSLPRTSSEARGAR